MSKLDEAAAREEIERKLLACLGRPNAGHAREVLDLARHAAQAIWLRDERLRDLEAWLSEYRQADRERDSALMGLHPEDVERVRRILFVRFGALPTRGTVLDFWTWASGEASATWLDASQVSPDRICEQFARSPAGLAYAIMRSLELQEDPREPL